MGRRLIQPESERFGMTKPSAIAVRGRASLVRPLLRLASVFFTVTLIVLSAAAVPNAAAAPLRPALTATNPGSPGASLTPRIQGRGDGVISSVLRRSASPGGPLTRTFEPGAIVTIYAGDGTCLNPAAIRTEGSVEELEGAGVQVTVGSGSITTFYATIRDNSGTSPCSTESVTYRQVNGPPSPPVFGVVTPPSPADDNFPHLNGSADGESTVTIYSSPDCSGQPLGSGSAATFANPGIQVPVADNSTTTFFATAAWGGFSSSCSASSISYQEVTSASPPTSAPSPPGTRPSSSPPAPPHLRTTPAGRANDNTPLISGSAPGAAAVKIFTNPNCDGTPVAKGSAAQFSSGLEVQVVDNVTVAFSGISVGSGGGESRCSAPVYYVEDSTIPHTRITMGPASKTRKHSVVFRFTDTTEDAPGTTFLCKVDRAKWKQCSSPLHLRRLHIKRYVLRVKATDLAGNVETRAATRRFKVIPSL
jgi:hypothetical protein